MPTIIVIEPHPLLRLGILQLLSDVVPGVKLEGAEHASSATDSPASNQCDLLLLSVSSLEDIHDLVVAAEHSYSPKAVLLISESVDMPISIKGLPVSVAGYVPKNVPPEVLQASVRLVLAGGTCFPLRPNVPKPPQALTPLYESVKWPPAPEAKSNTMPDAHSECQMLGLTPRQYEVLVLLARGYPMKTVGRYLNISVATAKAHTETLYQRLDVHNRNAAVYAAVSRGATLGWASISGVQESGAAPIKPGLEAQNTIDFRPGAQARQRAGIRT